MISFQSLLSAILLRHNCILLRNKSILLLSRLSFAILSGLTFAIHPFWLSFFQRIIIVTLAKINMCSLPGFYIRIVNWILIFFPRIKHALCLLKLISLEQLLLLLAFLVRFILKFSATHIKEQNHREKHKESYNNEGKDTRSLLRDHRIVDDNIDRSIVDIAIGVIIFCLEIDAEIVEL